MQHITTVNPSDQWNRGVLGFFLRIRGIASTVGVKLLVSGTALWLKHWTIAVSVLVVGAALAGGLWYIRRIRLRLIESDEQLHILFHEARDVAASVFLAETPETYRHNLDKFNQLIAQRVAMVFRSRLADPTINCGLRLAEQVKEKNCYVTRARSDGMDVSRRERSEAIPADTGLPRILREKEHLGVLHIQDIEKAKNSGVWMPTKTDNLPDVKTLLVAPINGWEQRTKAMVGILSVTSRKDVFSAADAIPVKAIVDYLGQIYPELLKRVPKQEQGNGTPPSGAISNVNG